MNRIVFLLIGITALLFAATASATVIGYGEIDPSTDVDYWEITLSADGTLSIDVYAIWYEWEFDNIVDSQIYLFENDSNGTLVAYNDDVSYWDFYINSVGTDDGSISVYDSYLQFDSLSAGTYLLAIGDYYLSESEARSGYNDNNYVGTGEYQLTFDSDVDFSVSGTTPVPEPATMLLLGSGLIGFAGVSRKKIFKKN
ncbi:DVUA0089 family protein [Desulfosarcina ovata]|uniref:Ice-binding protein C-terminal domain-containing protein n=2 Tax=Desulfosarcina ovata TaxID=83564 RepID=A0A5K8A6J1_9BACT|nr:DVUA0089 family protein [Desulfosarcina ovata]BBO80569.1 hypothetical protein DSCO28_11350 [Desulfosarcina ovata subsp. sediminis]BBO87780.1 hypothetical protein DSCOOX_09600 [Desulfosarcina ovata subsp. ovata]